MSSKNLTIDLQSRVDKRGQKYYIGKIAAPILIDCSQGAVFLVYTSEDGSEELQIALMDNSKE